MMLHTEIFPVIAVIQRGIVSTLQAGIPCGPAVVQGGQETFVPPIFFQFKCNQRCVGRQLCPFHFMVCLFGSAVVALITFITISVHSAFFCFPVEHLVGTICHINHTFQCTTPMELELDGESELDNFINRENFNLERKP